MLVQVPTSFEVIRCQIPHTWIGSTYILHKNMTQISLQASKLHLHAFIMMSLLVRGTGVPSVLSTKRCPWILSSTIAISQCRGKSGLLSHHSCIGTNIYVGYPSYRDIVFYVFFLQYRTCVLLDTYTVIAFGFFTC